MPTAVADDDIKIDCNVTNAINTSKAASAIYDGNNNNNNNNNQDNASCADK